jgi:hypothetical protein
MVLTSRRVGSRHWQVHLGDRAQAALDKGHAMKPWWTWGIALALLIVAGCTKPVEEAKVTRENGKLVFHWANGGAARICVTDPDVECPGGIHDKMPEGTFAYWFISARGMSCFPGGIKPPVTYGEIRSGNCMNDETDDNGGVEGGDALVPGTTYQVSILGFSGAPQVLTFIAP